MRHQIEHRVGGALEEHRRLQLAHQAGIEHQEIDVRRPAANLAGSYCLEEVPSAPVGRRAAPAEEIRVVEAALGVGLPDLDHHVVERLAVELADDAADLDHLALGALAGDDRQVVGTLRELARKERAERHLGGGRETRHMRGAALRPRTTSWYSYTRASAGPRAVGARRAMHR